MKCVTVKVGRGRGRPLWNWNGRVDSRGRDPSGGQLWPQRRDSSGPHFGDRPDPGGWGVVSKLVANYAAMANLSSIVRDGHPKAEKCDIISTDACPCDTHGPP